MADRTPPSSDVAFSGSVKSVQARLGSRDAYARMERQGGFETLVTEELAAFISAQRSLFLATSSAAGQPYVQHRGGPPGFLRVLDPRSLAFADFAGNRQFITLGNLAENPRVLLFLIDYAERRRVKIWGEATVIDDDPPFVASLAPDGYPARPQRALVVRVAAWDANCPQHIPQRLEAEDVKAALDARDARIAALEAEVKALRAGATSSGRPRRPTR